MQRDPPSHFMQVCQSNVVHTSKRVENMMFDSVIPPSHGELIIVLDIVVLNKDAAATHDWGQYRLQYLRKEVLPL